MCTMEFWIAWRRIKLPLLFTLPMIEAVSFSVLGGHGLSHFKYTNALLSSINIVCVIPESCYVPNAFSLQDNRQALQRY